MKVLMDKLAGDDLDKMAQSTSFIEVRRNVFSNLQLHEICTWLAFRVS